MKNKNASSETEPAEPGKLRSRQKGYWTKKKVLYWANIISLILIIFFAALDCLLYYELRKNIAVTISVCIVIQIAFTFLSLVIYYLSIIADALRYGRKGNGGETSKDQK